MNARARHNLIVFVVGIVALVYASAPVFVPAAAALPGHAFVIAIR